MHEMNEVNGSDCVVSLVDSGFGLGVACHVCVTCHVRVHDRHEGYFCPIPMLSSSFCLLRHRFSLSRMMVLVLLTLSLL